MLIQSHLNNGSFDVHGVYPDYMQMRSIAVQPGGRLLHQGDNTARSESAFSVMKPNSSSLKKIERLARTS